MDIVSNLAKLSPKNPPKIGDGFESVLVNQAYFGQNREMVSKGDLSSSVDSMGYDGGVLPQDLTGGMESMGYDCGVGSPGSLSVQGQQRTKRMRTSFKHHQLRTMKSYFAINQNPDAKDLKQLAQKTGLSKRVLQVWFQNARAKWRRNMMRQENGQQTGGGPGGPHGGGGSGGGGAGAGSGGDGAVGGAANPGGGGLGLGGLADATLEELHHHHTHHLVGPHGPHGMHPHGAMAAGALTLADLY
ncbi:LIM/homeobox protein Lhx9 [Frankliniella fusca]|uniref:LIM/homeobox protein Lhx9 n=1 Tax=Frankliniella fusca TaxID=407009 RepID=A0AAE1HLN3_9NEOP|nr:LIM/homeobox protein Lhx9 [Frankliniella fusca]